MPGVALQFHATNAEIVSMAADWAREFSLPAGLGMIFDDQATTVENDDFASALQIVPTPDFVILGKRPLLLPPGADLYRLKDLNNDILVLQPGRQRENGLDESVMNGIGDTPEVAKLWRRLIDRARRSMRSGAVITSPDTGELARLPSHRFTDGALQLQKSGVTMRNIAGTQTWRLAPDPTPYPLQDTDIIALATISTAVGNWMQNQQLPPPLYEQLKEQLARYKVANRGDTVGEVAATIHDLTRRLHDAFCRSDQPASPFPRTTTYTLHLPTKKQADSAAAAMRDRSSGETLVRANVSSRLPWRLAITLPGVDPDPAHQQNETYLTSLAQKHDGTYAGWQPTGDQTLTMGV
jgi:hypothetical protein